MTDKKEVKEYYDKYSDRQIKFEFNDRHVLLCNKLVKEVRSENTTILEIGCGIGAITQLISTQLPKVKIHAIDISSKSIDFANGRGLSDNINFRVQDFIVDDKNLESKYDIITLFDVLEHIPKSS